MKKFTAKSIDDVARFFGVDRRTAQGWFNAGCPRERIGSRQFEYDLGEVFRWVDADHWHLREKIAAYMEAKSAGIRSCPACGASLTAPPRRRQRASSAADCRIDR